MAMNQKVKLVDQISKNILFLGNGTFQDMKSKGLHISFQNETHQFHWRIYDQALIIESISDVKVMLTCKEGHQTKGHIETEFGQLDLDIMTTMYKKEESKIEVCYEMNGDQEKQAFHFILYIFPEEVNHEIH